MQDMLERSLSTCPTCIVVALGRMLRVLLWICLRDDLSAGLLHAPASDAISRWWNDRRMSGLCEMR